MLICVHLWRPGLKTFERKCAKVISFAIEAPIPDPVQLLKGPAASGAGFGWLPEGLDQFAAVPGLNTVPENRTVFVCKSSMKKTKGRSTFIVKV